MTTFHEHLQRIKAQIKEVDVHALKHSLAQAQAPLLIDVRERDETADGHIAQAKLLPRGFLELQIEALCADRSQSIVLVCAAGTRSALAAQSLMMLGYQDVSSLEGGFAAWKRAGFEFTIPKQLSAEQRTRYSRHLLIPEVGEDGQHKLLESKVLLLGAGGLGSPAALYLAAAGVGTLGVIDSDVVDSSNLQRQVLHNVASIGTPKVESAKNTIAALNPDVKLIAHNTRLTRDNALELLSGWDLIVDGGDNFTTRYLVNDVAIHLNIPVVHGSVYRFDGQVSSFVPHEGPCYRCLYPEPPPPELAPSCQEAGVLGVLPGVIGMLQATEAIKLLLQIGHPLKGRLLTFDALSMKFRELKLRRDPGCAVCGDDAQPDAWRALSARDAQGCSL